MILRQASLLFAALSLPLSAVQAKNQPIEELQRNGKWEINYDSESCHLFGKFGQDPSAIVVRFTRFEPGQTFSLDLFSKRFARNNTNPSVTVQFQPSGAARKVRSIVADTSTLTALILGRFDLSGLETKGKDEVLPPISAEYEAGVTTLQIRIDSANPIALKLESLGKPFAALRACTDNLVKYWGYDPQILATIKTAAQPANSPATWVTSYDYPSNALAKRLSGIVTFRLDVDSNGLVTNCAIIASTEPADFKTATCKAIIRRARFKPAITTDGSTTKSFYINQVRWLAF